jgi:hypothetical protein
MGVRSKGTIGTKKMEAALSESLHGRTVQLACGAVLLSAKYVYEEEGEAKWEIFADGVVIGELKADGTYCLV